MRSTASFLRDLAAALLLISSIWPSAADPTLVCSNRTASDPDRQSFISNFLATMDAVTPQIAEKRSAWFVAGARGKKEEGGDAIFAFGACLGDLSRRECDLCFATCKTLLLRCLPFQLATRAGRSFLDGCYLRYQDYDFRVEFLSDDDRTACGNASAGGNLADFSKIAVDLVANLSSAAAEDGFAVGSLEKGESRVYGLAQCWGYVNRSSCRLCLKAAARTVNSCVPMADGRAMNSGCYLRYSSSKFFNNSQEEEADSVVGNGSSNPAVVLAAVFSAVAAVVVVCAAVFFVGSRWRKRRIAKRQLGAMAAAVNKSNLNFKYELLEKATNYFHSSNKLGQGGSGSVYKGVLEDGRTVAVKKLVYNTRQWVDEFFNEVNLISGISHKNLVRLLGCSITGPESLLVYEFIPNQSLLHHLSEPVNARRLGWATRYRVLVGLAEGLSFLHERSPERIIHRDIKLSNILLDENFTTKIADFGLARLISEDNTHLSTAIAGTLGYMAPEYLVRGKLTEKADVYSFGVVVMETVCGRFKLDGKDPPDPLSLLQTVWRLFIAGELGKAVDPRMEGNLDMEEAVRILQMGLVCTQASAERRPQMSAVARMLRKEENVPVPGPPPFLGNCSNGRSSAAGLRRFDSLTELSPGQCSVNSATLSEVFPR
ncbi:cysteine-rich receptor-like protein kinase 3 [Wolffia australiana]